MKKSVPLWQLCGLAFVSIIGTLMHFIYDWSGENVAVGLFSAVNESIWEHVKLLFFPMLLYALAESKFISKDIDNFWCAKIVGILTGMALIPIIYYTYTGILGISVDWFNILIFFISAGAGFYVETKIMLAGGKCRLADYQIVIILLIIAVLFIVLTFSPPHIPLFRDPTDMTYGIKKEL